MRERAGHFKSVGATTTNGGTTQPGEIPMRFEPGLTVNLRTGRRHDVTQSSSIVAMADIGRPPCFPAMLKACGASVQKTIALADHQSPAYSDVSAFVDAGQTPVMTEKDAIKYRTSVDKSWRYLPVGTHLSGDWPDVLLSSLISLTR